MQRAKAGFAIIFLIAAAVVFSVLMKDVIEAREWPWSDSSDESPAEE